MSILSKSDQVRVSPRSYFHTVGARFRGTGDFDIIPKPIMQPRKCSISKWVGLLASGFKTKHSR